MFFASLYYFIFPDMSDVVYDTLPLYSSRLKDLVNSLGQKSERLKEKNKNIRKLGKFSNDSGFRVI